MGGPLPYRPILIVFLPSHNDVDDDYNNVDNDDDYDDDDDERTTTTTTKTTTTQRPLSKDTPAVSRCELFSSLQVRGRPS